MDLFLLLRYKFVTEGNFLLSNSVQNVNKINTGSCPHGLPPAACPICSGGAGSMKQSDRNRKIGEMTYHECAMIGNMMKARALAQKRHDENLKHQIESSKNFEMIMEKISTNISRFLNQISNNVFAKPIINVVQIVITPIISFVQSLPKLVQIFKDIKIDIMDKLTAIFGEAKAFIDKKISELVSVVKSKLETLFRVFKRNNAKDDDTKLDDDKKIFNLKTIIKRIIKRKKDDSNSQNK